MSARMGLVVSLLFMLGGCFALSTTVITAAGLLPYSTLRTVWLAAMVVVASICVFAIQQGLHYRRIQRITSLYLKEISRVEGMVEGISRVENMVQGMMTKVTNGVVAEPQVEQEHVTCRRT